MREIKFRAWEKNLKEIIPVHSIDFEKKMINTDSAWRLFDEIELIKYTGLKDKNGKEIYEGDIVQFTKIHYSDCSRTKIESVSPTVKGAMYYAEGLWLGLKKNDGTGIIFIPGMLDGSELNEELEVIGNTYENPSLLEE